MDIILERILSLIPRKGNGDFEHGAKKEFARSIGFKGGEIISDWIAGRNKSYVKHIHVIAEKYNVSTEWLTGQSDRKEKTAAGVSDSLSDEESIFLDQFRLMSEEERKFLLAQMRGVTSSRESSTSVRESSVETVAEPPAPAE